MANVTKWNWRVLLPASAALQFAGFLIFFATVSRHQSRPASAPPTTLETWMKLVMASTGGGGLMAALSACGCGIVAALLGQFRLATALLLTSCILACVSLRVFQRSHKPAKTLGVSSSFPYFVRGAYAWLLVAASLGVYAAQSDAHGGIWGASRHALTVGFLATVVFAIGQRLLPAFCGMRLLYSKKLMFTSLAILNLGCLLRVASEIPAYEANLYAAWTILPISAFTELTVVTLSPSISVSRWCCLPPYPAVLTPSPG